MRELSAQEVGLVGGGGWLDPMEVAISYSSTAIGAGVGMAVAGPAGGVAGAVVGFGLGLAMSTGYSLATGPDGAYRDDGMSCHMTS
jgi:outer membrane lipoprotein SlyB